MNINVIAFTEAGAGLCGKLLEALPDQSVGFAPSRFANGRVRPLSETLGEWTCSRFLTGGALVFIGAAGIAVRSVAPFVRDKRRDPAVISLDERGEFVIPLLSGHIGGANALARRIAEITGGTAVISTATDINEIWSPDAWAAENGCHIADTSAIKAISAALLEGRTVGFQSDFEIAGDLPPNVEAGVDADCGIVISLDRRKPYPVTLNLTPKCLMIGVGCRKGISPEKLEEKIFELLKRNGLPIEAVAGLATIDRKADEHAILVFCNKYRIPLFTYPASELNKAEGNFSDSRFVFDTVGAGNVCERAAALAGGTLIAPKTAGDGITVAVAKQDWKAQF